MYVVYRYMGFSPKVLWFCQLPLCGQVLSGGNRRKLSAALALARAGGGRPGDQTKILNNPEPETLHPKP